MRVKDIAMIATADTPALRALYVAMRGHYARTPRHAETGDTADGRYKSGDWLTQRSLSDSGRYGVIVEWIRRLAPQGPLLDLGAGDGLLAEALGRLDMEYLGVDYAPETVEEMNTKLGGPNRKFILGDATTYVPERKYPVIIFNDMLYYLTDPVGAVKRMAPYLEPGGVFIVAMFLSGVQIRLLHDLLETFDTVQLSYFRNSERCFVQAVLKPR